MKTVSSLFEISDVTAPKYVLSSILGNFHENERENAEDYKMVYVINECFEWKRTSRTVVIIFERAVNRYFIEFTDQDHMTINHRD